MIVFRSHSEIDTISRAGRIVAATLKLLARHAKAGTATEEFDRIAADEISRHGGVPAFRNYRGFPANICASVNEEVVHGIPSSRRLREGDIISFDVGVKYQAYFADGAITVGIGQLGDEAAKLLEVTEKALYIGIDNARTGRRLSCVSNAIQEFVEANGFSVVRQFVGHGIGTRLHEEPEVPNFGRPDRGPRMEAGMVLALEPMVNAGSPDVEIMENGWTAVTKDRRLSAHFEHTIALGGDGARILTAE